MMSLHLLDVGVIGLYFAIIAVIGFRVSRNSTTTSDYFVAGRSLPWWLAGTSMLATSFASTPSG